MQMRDKVQDAISGFEGIIVGKTEYLNGCVQFLVAGPSKDGKAGENVWVDDTQLTVIKSAQQAETPRPRGGPSQHTPPTRPGRR